jgi:hypothetical protein
MVAEDMSTGIVITLIAQAAECEHSFCFLESLPEMTGRCSNSQLRRTGT